MVPVKTNKVFHGWWMVGSGFLLMMYTTGVGFFGFTAFVNPISEAVAGGSKALIAGAVSIQRAEAGLLSPFIGILVDKVNPKVLLVLGFLIGGSGFIGLAFIQNLIQFYLAFFVVALGLGAGSFLVVSTAVSNWFIKKRGRALGMLFLGPSFAGIIVASIVWAVEAIGWRDTLFIIGVGMWVFCIPVSLVMKTKPEDYGLLPDGEVILPGESPQDPTDIGENPPSTFKQILWSRAYWQYVWILGLQQLGFSALVIFQIPALETFGLTTAMAGLVVLAWGLGGIPGRIGAGFLSDIIDKRFVLAAAFILQIIGAIFFLTTTTFYWALGYSFFHGAGWGGTTPARLSLQGEYWGRGVFGRLMGLQMGASAIGGIISPIFVGWMYDRTGDYHFPLFIVLLPMIISVFLILTIKKPQFSKQLK